MHTPSGSVAVLVFSRSVTAEARHKPLSNSLARTERAWQALERLTLAKIGVADLPAFVSHKLPVPPVGTFGEQLQQATQAVLNLGYSSVLCVGTDCPALHPADLREAARILEEGGVPIGADKRGGVYLAGFTQQLLTNVQAFTGLPWQTASLAVELLDYLGRQKQSTVLLSACYADWNGRVDVCLAEATGQRTWLYQLAEALHPETLSVLSAQLGTASLQAALPTGLRAPPSGY